MALGICDSASARVRVDLIEERRVVGKVEESRESVQGSGSAIEIVIIQFFTIFPTKFQTMISTKVTNDVAKLKSLLRENSGCCLGLVCAKANAPAIGQEVLNLGAWDAEVCRVGGLHFVVGKLGEIKPRFI